METKLKRHLAHGKFEDVTEERSRTMAAIRAKHNRSTEYRLRMAFVRNGIKGWKLHAKELPGNPDFYFAKTRFAVFVDGCYWHGCPLCGHIPKTRSKFWKEKFKLNQERDRRKSQALKKLGVSIIRIWEHELVNNSSLKKTIRKIVRRFQSTRRHSIGEQ